MSKSLRIFSVLAPSHPEPLRTPLVDPTADTAGLHNQAGRIISRATSGVISAWSCVSGLAQIIDLIPEQEANFTIRKIREILDTEYDPLKAIERLENLILPPNSHQENREPMLQNCIAAE